MSKKKNKRKDKRKRAWKSLAHTKPVSEGATEGRRPSGLKEETQWVKQARVYAFCLFGGEGKRETKKGGAHTQERGGGGVGRPAWRVHATRCPPPVQRRTFVKKEGWGEEGGGALVGRGRGSDAPPAEKHTAAERKDIFSQAADRSGHVWTAPTVTPWPPRPLVGLVAVGSRWGGSGRQSVQATPECVRGCVVCACGKTHHTNQPEGAVARVSQVIQKGGQGGCCWDFVVKLCGEGGQGGKKKNTRRPSTHARPSRWGGYQVKRFMWGGRGARCSVVDGNRKKEGRGGGGRVGTARDASLSPSHSRLRHSLTVRASVCVCVCVDGETKKGRWGRACLWNNTTTQKLTLNGVQKLGPTTTP